MKIILLFALGLFALLYLQSSSFNKAARKEEDITGIMNYPMNPIVQRCKKDHAYTDEDMIILEKELKRFLVLSASNESPLGMYSKDVDNLWHTFILFTKEYAAFCENYIHHFLHHAPEADHIPTVEELQKTRKKLQAFIKSYEAMFQEPIHPIWLLDMCEDEIQAS